MSADAAGGEGRFSGQAATSRLVLSAALRAFAANRGLESAATLAFYGFLALMPMLLLLVFGLSLLMRSSETALEALRQLARGLFPALTEPILAELLALTRNQALGWLSLPLLVWAVTPFTGSVRSRLQHVFRAAPRRSLWRLKARDAAAAIALLAVSATLVAVHTLASALSGTLPRAASVLIEGALVLGSWLVATVVLLVFYRAFSGVAVRWPHLAAGAITAAALHALMRPLFALVLRFNPDYGWVFGSLKAGFLLALWVYYTFAVLLIGAEVAAALRRKEALLLRGIFGARPDELRVPRVLLARFTREAGPGQTLFHEGDGGREMFYILAGEVSLEKEGRELRRMGPGDYFGEMSMLLEQPRTASARVASDGARLLVVARENFDLILRENPEIVERLLREMALRLRDTSEQVVQARG